MVQDMDERAPRFAEKLREVWKLQLDQLVTTSISSIQSNSFIYLIFLFPFYATCYINRVSM